MTHQAVALRPWGGRVVLRVERLEDRAVPSANLLIEEGPFLPTVQAGNPKGTPSDSAAARVDANTAESPFAGVGSLQVLAKAGTFVGTATAIGPRHILTAAHVVDLNGDGKITARDNLRGVYFILNSGENQSHKIAVAQFDLHPDYTGFARPSIHDDLAVLTLAEDLPEGLPIYDLPAYDMLMGGRITIVGYGRSGVGTGGYSTPASLYVKRVGENVVDAFYGQDDIGQMFASEVFRFDFDGPKGNGPLGGPSIGNAWETTLGPGDSGGPSLIFSGGSYVLAGVNTFVQGAAPRFSSMAGGMNVYAYLGFIRSILGPDEGTAPVPIPIPGLSPLPLLPIIGPSTIAPGGSGGAVGIKVGVKVGAKKISDGVAFAGLTENHASPQFRTVGWADSDDDAETGGYNRLSIDPERPRRTTDRSTLGWAGVFDSGDFLSVDLGLLTLATGVGLTVDD